jgi:spore maturation protein CgeB
MKDILIYKWRAYNYIDIIETFQSMGYHVDLVEQELKSYDEDEEFESRLAGILTDHTYDMVFTVNYYGCISNVCQRCQVKYVSWTCDNPLISMFHQSVYNDCNYIFTFDKSNYLEFKGMGVEHIWYLPLAVDTDRLDYLLETADDLYKYQNDIAFIGSLYERNTYDKLQYTLPDYLRGYLEATMQAQMSISGANIIEEMLTTDILQQLQEYVHLEKTKDSFSDIGLIFSTTVLGFKIAAMQRKRALIALSAKCPVSIYSNSDTKELIRAQYRGGVDYWSEMPKVFRMSKINLNFTIPNIKSGLPLRIWDVLGAGGFLMTNYQAEIPMYFEDGQDLICFEDECELVQKAAYYLEHEEERLAIAENGYRKVKQFHSYQERLTQMMNIIGQ